jgi:hypothetical protein
MDINKQIKRLQKHLKILDKWIIEYDSKSIYKGQCSWNVDTKKAIIYKFRNGSGRIPQDYIIHELLHIANAEVFSGKTNKEQKKEEKLIKAICGLLDYNKI